MTNEVKKTQALSIITEAEHLKGQLSRIARVAPTSLGDIDLQKKYVWRNLLILEQQMRHSPKLRDAEPESLLVSFMEIMMLGLNLGSLHEACIIPYSGIATAQFEYKGLVKLAMQTNLFHSIETAVVYQEDEWDYQRGLTPVILHTPTGKPERGEVIAAYMIANLKSGHKHPEWMWRHELDAIMEKAKGYQAGMRAKNDGKKGWMQKSAWLDPVFRPEMQRKTVLKRGLKSLPQSPQLAQAHEIEAAHEEGRTAIVDLDIEDGKWKELPPQSVPESTAGRMNEALDGQLGSGEPSEPPLTGSEAPPQPPPDQAICAAARARIAELAAKMPIQVADEFLKGLKIDAIPAADLPYYLDIFEAGTKRKGKKK